MTDNLLTLLCLVDGGKTSFRIKINSTETVDGLKELIKEKNSNIFSDVDAYQLTLWKVSIPVAPNGERKEISLVDVPSKEEFDETDDISDVFKVKPPKKTIHIIVQRPQGIIIHRPQATTIPKRSIPFDSVEKELALIIKDANRLHNKHTVDATEVETAQKEMPGTFYKKPLPYGTTASSMNLAILGTLGKEPTSSDNKTLREIVESDIGKTTDLSVVALVGRSGSGKTATVIDLAKRHFVVYCVCSNPRSEGDPDFMDRNFSSLAKNVEQMCQALPTPSSLKQRLDNDSRLKSLAGDRVELEFLARLSFLQLLLNNDAQLTPEQFFREQINGGAVTIGTLVGKLRAFEPDTIRDMLNFTQDKLAAHLNRHRQGLVIALDEAHIAGSHILPREFISPTATNTTDELFNGKGELKERYCRGFLTPLCATLRGVRATLVVLGTSLLLQDAIHVYSAVGKRTNFHRIMQFPSFDDQDVENVLSSLIDTSGCTLPYVKRRKLTGRARFSVSVIRELFEFHHTDPQTKQTKLEKACDSAINLSKDVLRGKVQDLLHDDRTGEVVHLLGRMVLTFKLQGGKIWFASSAQVDFMDKALCSLRVHSDGVHWLMDEPLVVEVVEEELRRVNVDPEFSEHLRQLNGIIEHLGIKPTAKKNALEPLKLQIDEINTASGFGYGADNTEADLKFLIARPSNKLLVEQSGTRLDGAWFFSDNQYAGSLAIKFYSNAIPQTHHQENETSSDIRCSFLQADGTRENRSLKRIRDNFAASGVPDQIKVILRIHLEFPRVEGMQLATYIKRECATGTEDVMAYIDFSNIDDFFYEGIKEKKGDSLYLKRLLKYVFDSS
ncbi:hypothetical protein BGZ68_004905 [Mortierella alpina]|nr:hypothetical protein BGZ68_004905 [Mortierella alpina]